MKTLCSFLLAALVGALVWGYWAGQQPAAARAGTQSTAVGPAWYAALPADPELATQAYLKRVPPEARARGDAFAATGPWILAARIVVLLASVALIMFSGASAAVRDRVRRTTRHVVLQDALVALFTLASLFVLGLPVDAYAGYVRLREAGFSDRTFTDWLGDAFLGWAVITIFYTVGIVLVMPLIRRRPHSWAGWATALYFVLSGFYVLITPQYIEPLFNAITPLADGARKQAILSMARANGVPATDVFVRDASRQGQLLNAHVSGVGGAAQIVLDDSTVAVTPKDEFELVMAHEIGHYVLGHRPLAILLDSLVTGAGFLLVGWSACRLVARFGRRWHVGQADDAAAIPLFWGLLVLWDLLSVPIACNISRSQEVEADIFGLNASQQPSGLAEFMIRDADSAKLEPSALEEWLFHDHPGARSRIFAAMRWRAGHLSAASR